MEAALSKSESSGDGILIVEDERIVAMDLARTLRSLGYAVVGTTARAEEAIALVTSLQPSLVLMDIRLAGEMDGIQAAHLIRRQHDVPLIYLTAHSDDETLQRAAQSIASGYVVKPFRASDLRCSIEIALHKHVVDARLRRNEQWLSTALDSIVEAIVATDADGFIRLFNPEAEILTGWARDEATRSTVDAVLTMRAEDTGAALDNPARAVLASRVSRRSAETKVLISRKGQEIPVEERAAPILDAFGRLLGSIVVLRDVSEQRRQQALIEGLNRDLERRVIERTRELQQANEALEAFSYSVAHDLRAPLRAVDGFSRLLLEEHADLLQGEPAECLQRIVSSIARMGQLIEGLLALARVGRSELQVGPVNLTSMTLEIIAELRMQNPGLPFGSVVDDGMVVQGDKRLLRTIMSNLLGNAIKFSSKAAAPAIHVGISPGRSGEIYFVRDNGAGFDPNDSHRLFGTFERLHDADEFPGTGIGLAIVRRAIERHRGRIWATTNPGAGATFSFQLWTQS